MKSGDVSITKREEGRRGEEGRREEEGEQGQEGEGEEGRSGEVEKWRSGEGGIKMHELTSITRALSSRIASTPGHPSITS